MITKTDMVIIFSLTWNFLKTLLKVTLTVAILSAVVWFFVEAIINA